MIRYNEVRDITRTFNMRKKRDRKRESVWERTEIKEECNRETAINRLSLLTQRFLLLFVYWVRFADIKNSSY